MNKIACKTCKFISCKFISFNEGNCYCCMNPICFKTRSNGFSPFDGEETFGKIRIIDYKELNANGDCKYYKKVGFLKTLRRCL